MYVDVLIVLFYIFDVTVDLVFCFGLNNVFYVFFLKRYFFGLFFVLLMFCLETFREFFSVSGLKFCFGVYSFVVWVCGFVVIY